MDSSSRKIVAAIAIITLAIIAFKGAQYYVEAEQSNITLGREQVAPREVGADASRIETPQPEPGFSPDVPTPENIPAIDGKPSMVFDNDNFNNDTSANTEKSSAVSTRS